MVESKLGHLIPCQVFGAPYSNEVIPNGTNGDDCKSPCWVASEGAYWPTFLCVTHASLNDVPMSFELRFKTCG